MQDNNEAARQALIEERLRARQKKAHQAPSIPRRPPKTSWLPWSRRSGPAPAPLSAAQKRIWILHQLDPASPVFNSRVAVRLGGELDRGALDKALSEVVRRHEALRSVFPESNGELSQVILPATPVDVEFQDLRGVPAEDREATMKRIASAEAQHSFDLTEGPVLRAKLVRTADREHVLLVLMHHIVFDGWSETVLLQELRQIYSAFARGQQPSLAELPIQYADFAAWQQDYLEQEEIARQVAYWRGELEAVPGSLKLPADYPKQGSMSQAAGLCTIELPAALTAQLKELSRQERASLFMTLLAAFQFLLAYYTDQDDIVVGVPASGRTRVETEALIGCFMNVLVLRARVPETATTREFLAGVRETALRAFANQEAPIGKVVEALGRGRRADNWRLFEVMFQLRNMPKLDAPDGTGLSVEPLKFDTGVIRGLDLNLESEDTGGVLRCQLQYDSALFRRETAERMLGHYRNLLEAMARYPDRRIWDLPILSAAERRALLLKWSGAANAFPADAAVHKLVGSSEGKTLDDDWEVCVVGRHGQALPIGAVGELCIGSTGLTRSLSTDSSTPTWIPHPFGGESEARMYRTGDKARYLPGNKIEFVSSPNDLAQPASESDKSFDAPRTPTEQTMAGIWSEILGVSPVGRNDDFFSLGGHSVAAGRVILGVRAHFKVKVKLVDLFRYPTVAGMAALIDFTLGSKAANGKLKSAAR
ncbi:MAG: condensation domain-containing protein [Bryobacterales bacterium]